MVSPKNDIRKLFSFTFSLPEDRRGRIVHCVGGTFQVAKRPGDETSLVWRPMVQGANRPGGEKSRGRNVRGENWQSGESPDTYRFYSKT